MLTKNEFSRASAGAMVATAQIAPQPRATDAPRAALLAGPAVLSDRVPPDVEDIFCRCAPGEEFKRDQEGELHAGLVLATGRVPGATTQ